MSIGGVDPNNVDEILHSLDNLAYYWQKTNYSYIYNLKNNNL
jgi:hypothetical protein